EKALADTHPGVREHALQLAEMYGKAALTKLVDDPSPRVQFQLALSLGAFPAAASWKALATLASRNAQDPWFRTAILTSVGQPPTLSAREQTAQLIRFGRSLSEQKFFDTFDEGKGKLLQQLAAGIGVRNETEGITQFLMVLSSEAAPWQAAGLSGLARGLTTAGAQRLKTPAAERQLTTLLSSPSEEVRSAARDAARHFEMRGLIAMSI